MSDTSPQPISDSIQQAARAIASSEAILIGAGAGMGVDSGLPDFRGSEGFWRAYPPFARLGLRFEQIADPRWFRDDPALAWGFYGHRRNLYRATTPHQGFAILQRWGQAKSRGAFVFTSNVDGHFQRSRFAEESVCEIHGSLGFDQCSRPCSDVIWPASSEPIDVNEEFRAREPLPRCLRCGALARPNILMFGDGQWNPARTDAQQEQMFAWLGEPKFTRLTIIEMGAGTAVPSVRRLSERLQRLGAALVRINPRESEGPEGTISIANGALAALLAIDEVLQA